MIQMKLIYLDKNVRQTMQVEVEQILLMQQLHMKCLYQNSFGKGCFWDSISSS
ncbi:unnamed protein product [Paramecium sonneborni]|uniref:Uncharacterized protein n=1 Tax=Paramecium sonneborni TaxID=65129 RepID=A0A8S1RM93_9CILI|nr:unnamed protein product [Paramecium sonneborni]